VVVIVVVLEVVVVVIFVVVLVILVVVVLVIVVVVVIKVDVRRSVSRVTLLVIKNKRNSYKMRVSFDGNLLLVILLLLSAWRDITKKVYVFET